MGLLDMMSNPIFGAGMGLLQSGGMSQNQSGFGGMLAGGLGGAANSMLLNKLQGMQGLAKSSGDQGLVNFGIGTNALQGLTYPQLQQLFGR